MPEVELVHYVDREVVPIAYVEDNVLWVLAGLLLMGAMLVIIGILGAFYLAGVWLAGRVERWVEARTS